MTRKKLDNKLKRRIEAWKGSKSKTVKDAVIQAEKEHDEERDRERKECEAEKKRLKKEEGQSEAQIKDWEREDYAHRHPETICKIRFATSKEIREKVEQVRERRKRKRDESPDVGGKQRRSSDEQAMEL